MRKTTLFAVAAALIVVGFGLWAASPAKAPASPSIGQGIEPHQLMVNAKDLSRAEFVDYTFVFH
jgi:Flp pilus assembly protein CpaB